MLPVGRLLEAKAATIRKVRFHQYAATQPWHWSMDWTYMEQQYWFFSPSGDERTRPIVDLRLEYVTLDDLSTEVTDMWDWHRLNPKERRCIRRTRRLHFWRIGLLSSVADALHHLTIHSITIDQSTPELPHLKTLEVLDKLTEIPPAGSKTGDLLGVLAEMAPNLEAFSISRYFYELRNGQSVGRSNKELDTYVLRTVRM